MESLDIGYDDDRFTTVVDQDLHCAICLNVLKEPMQCQSNEHHFCSACIKRHLENSQTCPTCMEELTLATLKKPSRFLAKNLSDLVIRCDYVDRGCSEVVVVADLKTHLVNCEFSPVQCSNLGCTEVMNKQEQTHHESQSCQFRKLRCDDCRETRNDIEEIKLRLSRQEGQISQVLSAINNLTQAVKMSSPQKGLNANEDIIVVGGRNENRLSSAEMFSWSDRAWVQLPAMKEVRSAASSVVYENKLIVAGGRCGSHEDSDTMEAHELDDETKEWRGVPPKLPCKISSHKCLVYKDRLFVIGGCENEEVTVFGSIYEILLTPPYSLSPVSHMPQAVCFHGAERLGNNIYVVGGSPAPGSNRTTGQVIKYDVNTHECNKMPSLPFPVKSMATVSWKNNVIIIGGENAHGKVFDTVVMYDVESGKSKMLPKMNCKRSGCTAVVSNNMIVVMGGVEERNKFLNAVESFSFDRYCWEELPSMFEPRCYATAVVKCGNFA